MKLLVPDRARVVAAELIMLPAPEIIEEIEMLFDPPIVRVPPLVIPPVPMVRVPLPVLSISPPPAAIVKPLVYVSAAPV